VFDLMRGHGTSARAILCAFDLLPTAACRLKADY
jgi:hypothetical protein